TPKSGNHPKTICGRHWAAQNPEGTEREWDRIWSKASESEKLALRKEALDALAPGASGAGVSAEDIPAAGTLTSKKKPRPKRKTAQQAGTTGGEKADDASTLGDS
ncbi:hypothetical protein PENSPDRAFT_733674, partial [Peniophora sp. CONT]